MIARTSRIWSYEYFIDISVILRRLNKHLGAAQVKSGLDLKSSIRAKYE